MKNIKKLFLISLMFFVLGCENEILIPKQANQFVEVYKPAGDVYFGPDTKELKEGQWYDRWIPNDHTFVKADDGKWHIFGITHPYTDPKKGGIHPGEYASFHAISSDDIFKNTIKEHHYKDLPKVLPPKDRPGEIPQNHAPYIVKKEDLYYMVYGYSPIRLASSSDLNTWTPKGSLFEEEKGARDPNLIYHNGLYYMTYCSEKCVRMRTSKDLYNWSEAKTILITNEFDPESPSVIYHNNTFYLFVCAWIKGSWNRIDLLGAYTHKAHVYASDDLMDFGTDAEKQITILNAHAPEIFQGEDGQWYISSVMYPGYGVSVDKLEWVEKDEIKEKKSFLGAIAYAKLTKEEKEKVIVIQKVKIKLEKELKTQSLSEVDYRKAYLEMMVIIDEKYKLVVGEEKMQALHDYWLLK